MNLQEKYKKLTDAATAANVSNLQVREQNGVLYIDGNAPSDTIKKQLWDIYNTIDPDYRAGDLVLNIQVSGSADEKEYEVQKGDNLSKVAAKYNLNWKDIYEANKDVIKNPDLIQPGWKLKIPQGV